MHTQSIWFYLNKILKIIKMKGQSRSVALKGGESDEVLVGNVSVVKDQLGKDIYYMVMVGMATGHLDFQKLFIIFT